MASGVAGVWNQNPGPGAWPALTLPLTLPAGTLLPPLEAVPSTSAALQLLLLRALAASPPAFTSPSAALGAGGPPLALSFPALLAWALKPPPQAQHPTPASPFTSSHL